MRYREILEAIDNDDDMFAPRFQFGNLSRPEALEKYNDLYDELYGYESYWHGDEPEFEEKERELERLKIYARQKFGEAFYNHMVGAEQTRDNRVDVSKSDPFRNRQHREDPRITKAGKLHKQDVLGLRNDVKNRIGTHRTPVLPESEDDDMFGSSTRPDSKVIAQDLELWLRRRQSSSRRPIIPSSEKYVQEVIAAFNRSFLNGIRVWSEYPLYGNTDIKYDIREYFEQTRSVNFMDYVDQLDESDESDEDLFGDGQQKVYVVTAPDDEILGMFDDIREAIAHAKKQVPIYLEDGWGDDDFITVYKQNWGEESGVPVAYYPITDNPIDENDDSDDDLFAAPTLRFDDAFNEYDEDELQQQGFSYGEDPARDVDIINDYLEGYKNYRVVKLTGGGGMGTDDLVLHLNRSSQLGEEESDDEMFGTSAGAGQRMIYTYGKRLLHKLEQAYNNPQIKQKYLKVTQDDEDGDEPFRLVLQATGAEFGKAFVVDTIVREFAGGMEGLNDFGWMIDDGIFNELTNGWEEFGRSTDVANEDWFRKELQTFMGDR